MKDQDRNQEIEHLKSSVRKLYILIALNAFLLMIVTGLLWSQVINVYDLIRTNSKNILHVSENFNDHLELFRDLLEVFIDRFNVF